MICYKEEKRDKASKGGEPVERTHGEIVVLALPEGKLRREVGEREEPVRSVEFLIVFAVTALNLAVVAGSVRQRQYNNFPMRPLNWLSPSLCWIPSSERVFSKSVGRSDLELFSLLVN